MKREENNIDYSMLVNNRTFYWKVALLSRRISYGKLKTHTEIINGKLEDNDFVMNSMEQMSKISSRSYQNKNYVKGYIRTDIKSIQQTMLMAMINTPDVIK